MSKLSEGVKMKWHKFACLISLLVPVLHPAGVAAQQLEEVIITAERRSQNIQEVPLSVAAIGGDELALGKVSDLNDVGFKVPGVSFNIFNVGEPRFYIRGIGNSSDSAASDQAVGVFLDEVYIGRTGGVSFDLFDLDRIEILRGPQGTLYGKNTNGGAINIVTTRPSQETDRRLSVSAGNYGLFNVKGLIAGGLTDTVSGKLVVQYQDRDGYSRNVITPGEVKTMGNLSNSPIIRRSVGAGNAGKRLDDARNFSVRGQLLFDLSDTSRVLLGGDYSKDESSGTCRHIGSLDSAIQGLGAFWALGMSPVYRANIRNCTSQFDTGHEREIMGAMARVELEMPWADFVSISAYRESKYNFIDDLTGLPLLDLAAQTPPSVPLPPLPGIWTIPENVVDGVDEKASQFSQEFRLTHGTGPVDWVAGAYYLVEDVDREEEFYTQYSTLLHLGLGLATIGDVLFTQDNTTTSMALYGQADWKMNDKWTLTYGLRWSRDEKKITQDAIDLLGTGVPTGVPLVGPAFPGPVSAKDSWSKLTQKASLSFRPIEGVMLYATYSEGFKSGAFPSQANVPQVAVQSVKPETVANYEGGVKSSWWNNRMQFNASYYYMDYRNLQVFELNRQLLLVLRNAQARSKGVDAEFNVLLAKGLRLTTSYNYSDATYTDFINSNGIDYSGNSLAYTPDSSYSVALDYGVDVGAAGKLDFNVSYDWKDDYFMSSSNAPSTRQKALGMLGANMSWTSSDDSWVLTLWGKNLTDELQMGSLIPDPTGVTSLTFLAPRTYGATIMKRF